MRTSAMEIEIPFVENVAVSDDTLCVDLSDGRASLFRLGGTRACRMRHRPSGSAGG